MWKQPMKAKLKEAILRTELGYRLYLKRNGFSKPDSKPTVSRYNAVLQTKHEWECALEQVKALGLPTHNDHPKNWDSLVALSLILQRTNRKAKILDAGGELYSVILPWLFLYGYKHLQCINLVFDRPYKRGPIRYEYGDITQTRFDDETFDVVTCLSVIEHGVNLEIYLKEMSRILKRNGILIASTDYWHDKIDTSGKIAYGVPIHIFSREEIISALSVAKDFSLEPISNINVNRREKTVTWKKYDLNYTFVVFSLQKKLGS
jgi:SAM-dependent methyltransferase